MATLGVKSLLLTVPIGLRELMGLESSPQFYETTMGEQSFGALDDGNSAAFLLRSTFCVDTSISRVLEDAAASPSVLFVTFIPDGTLAPNSIGSIYRRRSSTLDERDEIPSDTKNMGSDDNGPSLQPYTLH